MHAPPTAMRGLNFAAQIGRDSRLSGPLLASSMAAGIASRGARVAHFGLATTPAMFMSCIIEGEDIQVHLYSPNWVPPPGPWKLQQQQHVANRPRKSPSSSSLKRGHCRWLQASGHDLQAGHSKAAMHKLSRAASNDSCLWLSSSAQEYTFLDPLCRVSV